LLVRLSIGPCIAPEEFMEVVLSWYLLQGCLKFAHSLIYSSPGPKLLTSKIILTLTSKAIEAASKAIEGNILKGQEASLAV